MNKYHQEMQKALKAGPEIKAQEPAPAPTPEKKQTYSDLGSSVTRTIKNRNKRLQDSLK